MKQSQLFLFFSYKSMLGVSGGFEADQEPREEAGDLSHLKPGLPLGQGGCLPSSGHKEHTHS